MHLFMLRSPLETLEWFYAAPWGIVIWFNYVIIVERLCTSESMNPRPCFHALQYRFCSLLLLVTLLFLFIQIKKILPSIIHLYHHLFTELVHLYNLPLYWVFWGHKRFLVFGCRVVWERPSSSYASYGLINLRSSTWGKIATVLQTPRLEAQQESTRRRLHSRHHMARLFGASWRDWNCGFQF